MHRYGRYNGMSLESAPKKVTFRWRNLERGKSKSEMSAVEDALSSLQSCTRTACLATDVIADQ